MKTRKRDPTTEALLGELVCLTGPDGSDQSDREIQDEMAALNIKLSHESIRQYRNDERATVYRSSRRKLRAYIKWKIANPSPEDAEELAGALEEEIEDHQGAEDKTDDP